MSKEIVDRLQELLVIDKEKTERIKELEEKIAWMIREQEKSGPPPGRGERGT